MSARQFRNSWWVDFRYKGNRYRKRSPDNSKAGANAYEAILRREIVERGSLDRLTLKDKGEQLLKDFLPRWLSLYVDVNNKHSEQQTKRRVFKADLLPFFGKMSLNQISASDIETFKRKKLAEGQSPKTVNNSLAILRKCLVTAVDWEELEHQPRIKLLKVPPSKFKYLTPEELNRLFRVSYHEPWKAMVLVAARTGLRFSELLALEWESVNLSKRILCVRKACVMGVTGTPKNGKIRYIPLTQDVINALLALPRKGSLVFHLEKKLINYSTGRYVITRMCELAGIQVIGWHSLRHTFASHLVSKGASLKAVQELLGHSTINMTLRYSHLNQEDLRNTIKLLEPERKEVWATGGQHAPLTKKMETELYALLHAESPL